MSGRDTTGAGERSGSAVIFMYHRVHTEGAHPGEGNYAIPAELFTQHIRRLSASGCPVVGLGELAAGPPPGRSVVLTFDDGYDTDVNVALPLLEELSLPAAFFVSPALVGQPGYLDWTQVRRLADAGMLVGSHGLDHTLLDALAPKELERQLSVSRRMLEDHLGRAVDTLSLPGGSGGRRAVHIAGQLGYRLVLGSSPGRVRIPSPGRALPRFAVRRGHGPGRIEALAHQRPWLLASTRIRHAGMQAVRTALGPSTYERLRARLVSAPDAAHPRQEGS